MCGLEALGAKPFESVVEKEGVHGVSRDVTLPACLPTGRYYVPSSSCR
jgi:hypothetical protein